MSKQVTLRGFTLIQGLPISIVYRGDDGEVRGFVGVFDEWDAAKDKFAFLDLDETPIVLNGNDVLELDGFVPFGGNPRETCLADIHEQETFGDADPKGLDQHSPGAKLDAGKIYADAILAEMPRAIWGIAEVGTFGANKYSLGGWTSVEDGIRRYRDAAARHRLKRHMGEVLDPESGLPHRYHEAWNVLASLELEERQLQEL